MKLKTVALAVLLEAALVISWSAGFVGIRFASNYAPIFSILLSRSLASGLLKLPFALTLGPRFNAKQVLSQMAFGAWPCPGIWAALHLPFLTASPPDWWP